MKPHSMFSLAVALLGAMSLPLSAHVTSPATPPPGNLVRLHVDVDRQVLPSDTTEKAIVKIGLDAVRPPRRDLRPPVNVALVIDRSGSMAGDKIAKAREAALEAVRRFAPDDIVSVVVYDTHVQTLVHAQRVGNGRHLEQAICGIEVAGSTNLYGGVMCGAAEVRRHMEDQRYVNRVILLSDGLANVGPSSPHELGRLGASLMREGISVTTIGLGLGFNEDLMTRLAQCSDGNTYFVEHSRDLPRIFAAELGDVLNVVARRVVIEIEFPDGVRPLSFIGREGNIRGRRAELTLNQLYGGQEKFALIEVEVAPAKAGTKREIAHARVRYDDAIHQRGETVAAKQVVSFSADREAVIRSANHKVQADYAANVVALAKDEAVALVDANRRREAAARMRQRADELRTMSDTYQNHAVAAAAAPILQDADRVEQHGLGNADRKIYRAESAATKNQQASPR